MNQVSGLKKKSNEHSIRTWRQGQTTMVLTLPTYQSFIYTSKNHFEAIGIHFQTEIPVFIKTQPISNKEPSKRVQ